jgi:hypothetical protein
MDLNIKMNTLMFINGLDNIEFAYIANDPSNYGKFMCVYAHGGKMRQFAQHIKGGFNTLAEAIQWYLSAYPSGQLLSEQNFTDMQSQLLMLKMPSQEAQTFDPTFMTEKPRPTPAKRTADGKLVSDFE